MRIILNIADILCSWKLQIPSNKIVKLIIKLDQSEMSLREALKNSRDRADLFINVYI